MGSGRRAYCVLRLQKPTLHMASAMELSLALRTASIDRVPPTAARSFVIAASVTSSFVWDESMREMSVEKRWFCYVDPLVPADLTRLGSTKKRAPTILTLGSLSLSCACSHPMVSTGATMRARMRFTVSYVSRQRAGAGCGVARAVGMAFGLRDEDARFCFGRACVSAEAFDSEADAARSSSESCALMPAGGFVPALAFLGDARSSGGGLESAFAPSSGDRRAVCLVCEALFWSQKSGVADPGRETESAELGSVTLSLFERRTVPGTMS